MLDEIIDCYMGITTTVAEDEPQNKRLFHYKYEPTSYVFLERLFSIFPFNQSDHMVDFGCGKGRVLLVAAQSGCLSLSGCEVNELRFHILKDNIESFLKRRGKQCTFTVENISADKFSILPDMNKFFFFTPFHVKIYAKVIQNISASLKSRQRDITLFLYKPWADALDYIDRTESFHRIVTLDMVWRPAEGEEKRRCQLVVCGNYDCRCIEEEINTFF